jgi:hypothetical protein
MGLYGDVVVNWIPNHATTIIRHQTEMFVSTVQDLSYAVLLNVAQRMALVMIMMMKMKRFFAETAAAAAAALAPCFPSTSTMIATHFAVGRARQSASLVFFRRVEQAQDKWRRRQ